jgi:uncharacterized integral membrane protein
MEMEPRYCHAALVRSKQENAYNAPGRVHSHPKPSVYVAIIVVIIIIILVLL